MPSRVGAVRTAVPQEQPSCGERLGWRALRAPAAAFFASLDPPLKMIWRGTLVYPLLSQSKHDTLKETPASER